MGTFQSKLLFSGDVLNWIEERFGSSATITPTEFDVAAKRWIDSIQLGGGEIAITMNIMQIHEPYILGYSTIIPIYPPYTFVLSTCFVNEYDGQYFQTVKTVKVFDEKQIDPTLQSLRNQFGISESCIPNWQCRIPLDGYEEDGCSNTRYNTNCEPSCISDWQCEIDLYGKNTGYKIDINRCSESVYDNIMCPVDVEPPEPTSDIMKYILPIGIGIGLLAIMKSRK